MIVERINIVYLNKRNHSATLVILLEKTKVAMNSVNKRKRTALHIAVDKELPDCVDVLLQNNCDVNMQVNLMDILIPCCCYIK